MAKRSNQAVLEIEAPSGRLSPLPKSRAQSRERDQISPLEETGGLRPAQRAAEDRRPSVCLLSGHPAVLSQLAQAIPKSRFRVLPERFGPPPAKGSPAPGQGSATARKGGPFPPAGRPQFARHGAPVADLYVVDGLVPRARAAVMLQQILDANPAAGVLIIGEKGAEEDCFDLLVLGARGLLTYDEVLGELRKALKCLEAGGYWLTPLRLGRFMAQLRRGRRMKPAVAPLSRRQQEILEKLARNLSNKEIAHELNISERTVKFHVSNLLEKFQVRGRTELVLAFSPGPHFGFPATWQEPARPAGEFSKAQQQSLPRVLPGPKEDRGMLRPAQARRPFASVS